MISVHNGGINVLQFEVLNAFDGLFHFASTRVGGYSTGNYVSLNLGYNSGDRTKEVNANRHLLCKTFKIDPAKLIFPKQTHSDAIKVISSEYFDCDQETRRAYLNETDAVITDLKGVCICVKTADCVPVLVFDPQRKIVAAIHAGWRGTVQNIVYKTIGQMIQCYGSNPSDLWAGIGPSISPEVYEVGEEVWSQFSAEFYSPTIPAQKEKRLLNLWRANLQQLVRAGVPENQIEIARICTFSDVDRFYSARRDGAKTGRMATGIMLK